MINLSLNEILKNKEPAFSLYYYAKYYLCQRLPPKWERLLLSLGGDDSHWGYEYAKDVIKRR